MEEPQPRSAQPVSARTFDVGDAVLLRAGRAAFGVGFSVRAVARLRSTQDAVREAARAGAPAGTCWVAGEQTQGRGRQGRRWEAAPGTALLASVLVRPAGPLGWVALAAGLAVAEALAEVAGVATGVKWPNDVLALNAGGAPVGKLAGLLAEVEPDAPAGAAPAVVLGMGVNVRVEAFAAGIAGASLHRLTAGEPPRLEAVLAAVLGALGPRLTQVGSGEAALAALRGDWQAAAVGLGGLVHVATPAGEVNGTAEGIDGDGALVVVDAAGARHRLVAGDVHLRPG